VSPLLIAAKAATKIQAVFRGHKVRETMKKSETKTATNNGSAAGAAPSAAAAEAAASAEPTKAELEAEFDPNDKGKWVFHVTGYRTKIRSDELKGGSLGRRFNQRPETVTEVRTLA